MLNRKDPRNPAQRQLRVQIACGTAVTRVPVKKGKRRRSTAVTRVHDGWRHGNDVGTASPEPAAVPGGVVSHSTHAGHCVFGPSGVLDQLCVLESHSGVLESHEGFNGVTPWGLRVTAM